MTRTKEKLEQFRQWLEFAVEHGETTSIKAAYELSLSKFEELFSSSSDNKKQGEQA